MNTQFMAALENLVDKLVQKSLLKHLGLSEGAQAESRSKKAQEAESMAASTTKKKRRKRNVAARGTVTDPKTDMRLKANRAKKK